MSTSVAVATVVAAIRSAAFVLCGCGESSGSPGVTAVVNLMRHGEKCGPDAETGLSAEGMARSLYLAKCMSKSSPSALLPFGSPSSLMASVVKNGSTTRPRDTLLPLAEMLGVEVAMPCKKKDSDCFMREIEALLFPNATVVVAWQHEFLPDLVEAVGIGHGLQSSKTKHGKLPKSCESLKWREPTCESNGSLGGGSNGCYDLIFQIVFRQHSSGWVADSMRSLHQGFAGRTGGECFEDLSADECLVESVPCRSGDLETAMTCCDGMSCARPQGQDDAQAVCVKQHSDVSASAAVVA